VQADLRSSCSSSSCSASRPYSASLHSSHVDSPTSSVTTLVSVATAVAGTVTKCAALIPYLCHRNYPIGSDYPISCLVHFRCL
jgi:hypothetical protein